MPVDCQRSTSGGKGNIGMFIKRDPQICAAGLPSAQPDDSVQGSLQHYLLKDEVDSLMGDAIIPETPPRPIPPFRRPIPQDKRNSGLYGQVAELVNPPKKTNFQTLVDDFKETVYDSYWQKPLGKPRDPVPMLPNGLDTVKTTFGKKTESHGTLYDIVMPKVPMVDKSPRMKEAGVQLDRVYCTPAFNPNLTYGHKTVSDKGGTYAKCCLTDDRVIGGHANKTIINTIHSDFIDKNQAILGTTLAPNDNISNVPEGFSFGILKPSDNLPECLINCDLNPAKKIFLDCLKHLNTLRKVLSKRFLPNFFNQLYLNIKYCDTEGRGWLPKGLIYDLCAKNLIRFDPSLIEPLLSMWQAFDGANIEYKTFVHVINYREPTPELRKVKDVPDECLDFRTTYTEMVKPGQEIDKRKLAGVPSGRYFDLDYPIIPENCCRATRTCLPQESDMKSCLNPSVMTLFHVSHRDMYAKREPGLVRKVFEAAGEKLTQEEFDSVWENAKKYHSEGWVSFETFRSALEMFYKNKND
ncbi:unnamed protein product [Leptidea sinapis]|uniref:EFHB C-terminal EF-hand domain-containing protein n=1 Tax=Leptidea sinapis TaxID=189913 RepID=A0A5E4R341_9NEOP|nr:unnamed protein product [Leptidea sinapis]